jgi:acetyl esterase
MRTLVCKKYSISIGIIAALFWCSTILNSCTNDESLLPQIKPEGPVPEWGRLIDEDMLAVIEQLNKLNPASLQSMSIENARHAPTPKDAVDALLKKYNITPPKINVDVKSLVLNTATYALPAKIYTPRSGKDQYPMIVYFHGRGWSFGSPDDYEYSAIALAEKAEAIVISVDYRLAPEFKFPTANEDAYAAYQWARENGNSIKGDIEKVAVAGEGAGGTLAGAICIMARDRKYIQPTHQLLIYPITRMSFISPSYLKYEKAKPLDKGLMSWLFRHYITTYSDGASTFISLLHANVKGLAPATIITAEIDPLNNDGRDYAAHLEQSEIPVTHRNYEGLTHDFFGMGAVVKNARAAQDFTSAQLRKAFERSAD